MGLLIDAQVMLAVLGFTGVELILIAVIALILFGANKIPPFLDGLREGGRQFRNASRQVEDKLGETVGEEAGGAFGKPVLEALTHSNVSAEFLASPNLRLGLRPADIWRWLIVWLAHGFGIRRIMPSAPDTWASLAGLLWCALLLAPRSIALFLLGATIGLVAAGWLCGEAARILKQEAASSMLLDKIVAVPICYLTPLLAQAGHGMDGLHSSPSSLFVEGLPLTILVFVLFRLVSAWKPWPMRLAAAVPGGWGMILDDVAAAAFVNLALMAGLILLAPHWS